VFSGLEIFPEIFGNISEIFPRAGKNWKFLENYYFLFKSKIGTKEIVHLMI